MSDRVIKKGIFRKLLVLLTVVFLLSGVARTVAAGTYESDRKGSLDLMLKETVQDKKEKVFSGVVLKLYKVGSIRQDGSVSFVLDPALDSSGVDLDKLTTAQAAADAAEKLAAAAAGSSLSAQEAVTDEKGHAVFADLEQGMYLILQGDVQSNVKVAPMLLSVPYMEESGNYLYDVKAYPKVSVKEESGKIEVTKQIYSIDDKKNVRPMVTEERTYCVGLYLDRAGTIPFRADFSKEIVIKNASSSTVSYEDVPDGTYYLFEMDKNGKNIPIGEAVIEENKTTLKCVIINEQKKETNQVTLSHPDNGDRHFYVNNYYRNPSGGNSGKTPGGNSAGGSSSSVKTGDETPVAFYMVILLAAVLAAAAVAAVTWKKHKK